MADNGQVAAGFGVDGRRDAIYALVELRQSFSGGKAEGGGKRGPLLDKVRILAQNLRKRQPFPLAEINFMQAWIKGDRDRGRNSSLSGWRALQALDQGVGGLARALCRAAPQPLNGLGIGGRQALRQLLGLRYSGVTEGNIAASDVAPAPLRANGRMSDQGDLFWHGGCFHASGGATNKKSP